MPRITIFAGRFGSGKTEISLNYALGLAGQEKWPVLIDLDIVTPYFRTRDKAEEMAQRGVEAVAPFAVGHHIDMPAISPRILGAIEQPVRPVVIDSGGDEQGARALAQYAPALERQGYAMQFVVNPYRPFMDSVAGIGTAIRGIEASSRLRVSALVSNPNLMSESTCQLFREGHRLIEEASRALGLPIAFAAVGESLLTETPVNESPFEAMEEEGLPILALHRFFLMFDTAQ